MSANICDIVLYLFIDLCLQRVPDQVLFTQPDFEVFGYFTSLTLILSDYCYNDKMHIKVFTSIKNKNPNSSSDDSLCTYESHVHHVTMVLTCTATHGDILQ